MNRDQRKLLEDAIVAYGDAREDVGRYDATYYAVQELRTRDVISDLLDEMQRQTEEETRFLDARYGAGVWDG